jgi:hypothetical protein
MLGGMAETLPLFRGVNHHILLVDEEKKYNYYLPKCSDLRKSLSKKISKYCKAGWWHCVKQAAPMLIIPKKNGMICTVINALK